MRVLAAVGRTEDNAEQGEAPLSSTDDADVSAAAAVDREGGDDAAGQQLAKERPRWHTEGMAREGRDTAS